MAIGQHRWDAAAEPGPGTGSWISHRFPGSARPGSALLPLRVPQHRRPEASRRQKRLGIVESRRSAVANALAGIPPLVRPGATRRPAPTRWHSGPRWTAPSRRHSGPGWTAGRSVQPLARWTA